LFFSSKIRNKTLFFPYSQHPPPKTNSQIREVLVLIWTNRPLPTKESSTPSPIIKDPTPPSPTSQQGDSLPFAPASSTSIDAHLPPNSPAYRSPPIYTPPLTAPPQQDLASPSTTSTRSKQRRHLNDVDQSQTTPSLVDTLLLLALFPTLLWFHQA